jgi:quinol monooxygenase YgiN
LREVQYIVDESNREPGMVVYTLCQAAPSIKDLTPQGDKFYMVEQCEAWLWRPRTEIDVFFSADKDKDAFKHHATSPHFKKCS